MSCYGWEAGTLKLSTAAFPKLRKAILDAANARRVDDFRRAEALYRRAKAGESLETLRYAEENERLLDTLLLEKTADGRWGYRKTPKRPLKRDFAPLPAKTLVFRDDWNECAVTFDPKARTVRWSVAENNRSVERAHAGWLGRAFFAALGRVEWTRGTGGELVGNDEYHRDSEYAGGGGNYVTARYGPLGGVRPEKPRRLDAGAYGGYRW